MVRDALIICDSNIPWHHNRYSKHHLMSRLARMSDVVFVNPQVDALQYVRQHGIRALSLRRRCVRVAGEELELFDALRLPMRGKTRFLQRLDERYLCSQVRGVVRRHDKRAPVLFVGNPWNVFLIDAFPSNACVLYHCSDDFPALFRGRLASLVAEREQELVRRADVVLCSHPKLAEKCAALGGNVHLLEHAVDERFIGCCNLGLPRPSHITGVAPPIIGLTGSLDAGVDYDLLAEVARGDPTWNLVLVGPVADAAQDDVMTLRGLPNVHVVGPQPWELMPQYLAHFDVAIIPFRQTGFNRARSPLKLFEYLAAGLPVVSVDLEVADALRPFIRLAGSPQDFVAQLAAALLDGTGSRHRQEQIDLIEQRYAWDGRAQELSDLIEQHRRC